MKKLGVILLLLFVFAVPCVAAEDTTDPYAEEYRASGADGLPDALPDDTADFLGENGIDPSDYNWVNELTGQNVFTHIFGFLKSGAKSPLRSGAALLGIILIAAAFTAAAEGNHTFVTALYATTLAAVGVLAVPVWSSVSAAVGALKGCGVFLLSFIPIFAAVVSVSGGTVTAVSMSALLLGAAEVVTSLAAFAVLPMMGWYLAMSIGTSVSPLLNRTGIAEGFKKIAMWVMTLISTVFVGILGIQTAVNSAADSLSIRTTKFIVGTAVPVAGAALSEAVSTLTASLSLLRSSVGIYGVVALAALLLPILAELIVWRAVLLVCATVSDVFAMPKLSGLLRAVDMMLALLLGVLLLTAAMFIISLTVVIGFGRTA